MLYINIVFIVVVSVYVYWLWGVFRALTLDAPYVPMKRAILDAMMNMVNPKPGDLWIDLGCGDGRVLIAAVKKFDVRGLGIEQVSVFRALSRLNILLAGYFGKIKIEAGNFFKKNLSRANVISFYLLPEANRRLIEKLKKELKPGTLIISHRFPLLGIPLVREDKEKQIYVAQW